MDATKETNGIRCPKCRGETGVPITRKMPDGTIRRMRECKNPKCRELFLTRERIEPEPVAGTT